MNRALRFTLLGLAVVVAGCGGAESRMQDTDTATRAAPHTVAEVRRAFSGQGIQLSLALRGWNSCDVMRAEEFFAHVFVCKDRGRANKVRLGLIGEAVPDQGVRAFRFTKANVRIEYVGFIGEFRKVNAKIKRVLESLGPGPVTTRIYADR